MQETVFSFLRAVSDQLYGTPNRDMETRDAAVDFMRRNPERFIESNTDMSWVAYLIRPVREHGVITSSFKLQLIDLT